MSRIAPASRPFLIACSIVLVGAAGWRLLAPRTAQGPAPVSADGGGPPEPQTPLSRNIIVFETDDQRWDSIDLDLDDEDWVMPNVYDIFIEGGVHFRNAFVTNPTCCPSRASQLSGGFYSHNTGVLTNTWPNGSAVRFEDDNALAVRMKDTYYIDEAYYTVLIGKYMNGYEDLTYKDSNINVKKGRYIPRGWDLFMVVHDSKDWDRGYELTVGGNPDGPNPKKGVILPKDTCKDDNGNCIDNWNSGLGGTLRADLQALGVPDGVIDLLEDEFPFESNESLRDWTYLPELEKLLAVRVLENLPDPENQPLFMMLTMAPPHGPTQLSAEYCGNEDPRIEAFEYDDDPRGGYGEGYDLSNMEVLWEDIADKPSWMQGNPDAFAKQVACEKSLLHCYRGEGCDTQDCSGDGGTCDREEDPEDYRNYRALQRAFSDELASLRIIDTFIAEIKTTADTELGDNTVFFFTSDHGTMWGEHGEFQKGAPYEEAIRVPFAVAGTGIRSNANDPIKVDDMIAFDLDMPATILQIAGYTRDEISDPDLNDGLIHSDGCSLLGILGSGATWGDCYTDGQSERPWPREKVLVQSFRNLAPNSTPSWAGLRLKADGQLPLRKHVITDTHEHEFYDLTGDPEAYELDNLVCTDPGEVDDHRTEIAAARGLVITLDDPSIVDWDLPMGIPGQSYSVTFKAEGGVGPYSWCLWEFTNDDEFDYCADACPQGLEELGCLFEDVTPHDPEKENDDPDCLCPTSVTPVGARVCPCVCGLPEGFTFSGNGDTATISGTYPQNPASCFEFVLGVMDSSESLYTGQHQKYLRRFRIRTGVELNTSDGGGYDTYVSEGDSTNHCAENKLVVSKDGSGGADGRVTFLRFDREEAGISADYLAVGGELILHATDDGDLTDVTLYYVEEGGVGDCRKQYAAFPDCGDAVWGDWDAMDPDYVVPIARICSIQAGQHVRFDVTPYLTKRYLDCVNQIPYYQFVIASNETNAGRGFHASGSTTGDPPRLTFIHTTFSTANENNQRCEDCRDNDCDGLVDCEDTAQCDPCDP